MHKKPSKAIIIDPLRKVINRRKIEEKGVRHLRVRNQKLEWRRENSRASLLGKETSNCTLGMDSPLGASRCRISIHLSQQVNCEPSIAVSPLTELMLQLAPFVGISYLVEVPSAVSHLWAWPISVRQVLQIIDPRVHLGARVGVKEGKKRIRIIGTKIK